MDEEEEAAPEEANDSPEQATAEGGGATNALPDDEEFQRREEHSQRLMRSTMGMGEAHDGGEAPLGFSSDTLDQVQTLWDPLAAGELLARVGHFIRIMSQMMEEVGYLTESLSRGHREAPKPDDDTTTLMQRGKRP